MVKGIWRKGQFFLVGAFMLCTLFYIGLPKTDQTVIPVTQDLNYIADNIEKDIPRALNLGLNESKPIEDLFNFTGFVERIMLERLANFRTLWIVTENISTNDLNITAGNLLGSDKIINITIGSSSINLTSPYNTTNYTNLGSDPGAVFNMTILFDSENATMEWQRDKLNIYAFIELERGDDLIKKEIAG